MSAVGPELWAADAKPDSPEETLQTTQGSVVLMWLVVSRGPGNTPKCPPSPLPWGSLPAVITEGKEDVGDFPAPYSWTKGKTHLLQTETSPP